MEQLLGYRIYQTNKVVSVRWIQQKLNRIMQTQIREDDKLGPETISLIRRFQQSRNLTPDGQIGPLTLEALMDADPWKNKKAETAKESNYDKITNIIDNIIDALDEAFYNNKGLVGLSFFTGSDSVKDLKVGATDRHSLSRLYNKALNEKDFFKKKIKAMPESYINLGKELNNTKSSARKLQIQEQMKSIRVNHLREVSTAKMRANQIVETINKVKNIGTTLNECIPKIMSFLKPLGKIFKVIEWSSVVVYIKKGWTYFSEGKWIDGYEYLCKAFSKILEIGIMALATSAAVAGTVALCATAGLGTVATAIAALAATIVVAIIIFCISYFWNKYIEYYFDNL